MNKKTLRKITRTVVEFMVVFTIILAALGLTASAKNSLPLDDETAIQYKEGLIPGPYSADLDNPYDTITELIATDLLGYAKIIIAAIAILYITVLGYKIATADSEEEATKMRKGITYALVGLVLISLSSDLAKVFDFREGTIFENPDEIVKRVDIFDTEVKVVITFIKYILAFYAALMIVRFSLKLIVKGGDDEGVKENRTKLIYSIGGLLLLYLSDIFINNVFYDIDKDNYAGGKINLGIDPERGANEIIGITNTVVSFLGPVAILMLVGAGIMYITSGGEDDKMQKAKRMIVGTLVGIVIIYGSFAIVSTILSGSFDPAASQIPQPPLP